MYTVVRSQQGSEMIMIRGLFAWTVQTADREWLIGGNHTEILSERCEF